MAGQGPAPKDPSRRVRRNKDEVPTTTLRFQRVEQPRLPEAFDWPVRTREWWSMWADSPQADHFTVTDWEFLLDTALIHAEMWSGNAAVAPELRLRVAKFGATPEDRMRLRMTIGEPENDAATPVNGSVVDISSRRKRLSS